MKACLSKEMKTFPRSMENVDDVIDAYVLAWTALNIFQGMAECVPVKPDLDRKGLRMGIWF